MPVSTVVALLSSGPVGFVMKIVGLLRSADSWYLPSYWWPGLVLGFFINRRYLHRAACFVWLPGLLWLAYGIPNVKPQRIHWEEVRLALFPLRKDDCGVTECLYVFLFTWPALNAAAYSIGAWLGLLFMRRQNEDVDPYTKHTLGLQ
jgi:hypothetical protein